MRSGTDNWVKYYEKKKEYNNYYPENFVTRVFLSNAPVSFLKGDYEGKTVLDLGCGHGRNIPFLLNCGFDVTGVEVTETLVEALRKSFRKGQFHKAKAQKLPFQDSWFDYILACNSIYYLDDEQESIKCHLSELSRVLKPEGRIVFSMLGSKHSILSEAEMLGAGLCRIRKDFLGFREGTKIQYFDNSVDDLFSELKILHRGEIVESVDDWAIRHLFYFVAALR